MRCGNVQQAFQVKAVYLKLQHLEQICSEQRIVRRGLRWGTRYNKPNTAKKCLSEGSFQFTSNVVNISGVKRSRDADHHE